MAVPLRGGGALEPAIKEKGTFFPTAIKFEGGGQDRTGQVEAPN